jgi:hypothetical protein
MHASIWKFRGDPDELLRSYDSMVKEIPRGSMKLHLCLRAEDGIVLVDTCPTREAFDAFVANPDVRMLRERHRLPEPESIEDFPVAVAFVAGQAVAAVG